MAVLLQSRQDDAFSQIPSLSLFKEHKQLVQHSSGFLYPFKHHRLLVVYTYHIKKNGNEEIMTTSLKRNNDSIAKEKKKE